MSCLSTYICLYLFVNPGWRLTLSISLSIQIQRYIFQSRFLDLYLIFVYTPIFVSVSCLFTSISLYLIVNPDWRLYLLNPFSLSLSILRISTYTCFYVLPIHLYFILSLFQSRLTLISFYLSVNPNSEVYLSIPFSWSLSNLRIYTYICFCLFSIHPYFFISLYQSKFTAISFYLFVNPNSCVYFSIQFSLSLIFVYPSPFCLLSISTSISVYIFVNPNWRIYLSNSFSLSLSNLRISTYICFYLLHPRLFLFITLKIQFGAYLFFRFVNPNSRVYFSIPFSLSLSILCISIYICFYLLSCLSTYISLYLIVNPGWRLSLSISLSI